MITQPFEIEQINNHLLSRFGRTVDGKQKFRLVWSEDQIEYRKTSYIHGIQLVYPRISQEKKYSYIKDRWILEIWMAHSNPEILTVDGGTYEPVWVFQDKNGNFLKPIWSAVEILCDAAERARNGEAIFQTEKQMKAEDEEKFRKEIAQFEEMIDTRDFGNQTDAFVPPVFIDSTKVRK